MLAALEQKILPHFMAQDLQRVQLLVIVLGATAHASFRDLAQPFRTVARCIDLRACTRNGPAPIQGLHPIHDVRYTNRNWLTLFLPSGRQVEKAECFSAHQLASPSPRPCSEPC